MTALYLFGISLLKAIGAGMIHSLWVGILLFILWKIVMTIIPGKKANLAFGATYLFSVLLFVAFLVASIRSFDYNPVEATASASVSSYLKNVVTTRPVEFSQDQTIPIVKLFKAFINKYSVLFAIAWFTGFIILFVRFLGGLLFIERMKRLSVSNLPDEVKKHLPEICHKMNLKVPRVKISKLIESPVVTGIFRSIIFVPAGFFSAFPPEHIEAVLLHELAHIKRRDYLLNLIHSIIEIMLFFHPLIWLFSDALNEKREQACDDMAIKYANKTTYAEALAALSEYSLKNTNLLMALNNNRNRLLERIKRIFENQNRKPASLLSILFFIPVVISLFVFSSWNSRNEILKNDNYSTPKAAVLSAVPVTPVLPVEQDTTKKKKVIKRRIEIHSNIDSLSDSAMSKTIIIQNGDTVKIDFGGIPVPKYNFDFDSDFNFNMDFDSILDSTILIHPQVKLRSLPSDEEMEDHLKKLEEEIEKLVEKKHQSLDEFLEGLEKKIELMKQNAEDYKRYMNRMKIQKELGDHPEMNDESDDIQQSIAQKLFDDKLIDAPDADFDFSFDKNKMMVNGEKMDTDVYEEYKAWLKDHYGAVKTLKASKNELELIIDQK